VERLAVLDVLPIVDVWEHADARLAIAYWPWSLLAQPEPLPERLITTAPDAVVDNALGAWGSSEAAFSHRVRTSYVEALSDPIHVRAICEEYRAAASLDRKHDLDDREAGRRITSPLLVLWSGEGPLATWYGDVGGPLGIWKRWADHVTGRPLAGGHFFPEELP